MPYDDSCPCFYCEQDRLPEDERNWHEIILLGQLEAAIYNAIKDYDIKLISGEG